MCMSSTGSPQGGSSVGRCTSGASVCIHVLFHDSSPLLTCVFRRPLCLRAWSRPRFDLRCSSKGQDRDQTPSANILALCPTTTDAHRRSWGDRLHAEPERVEPAIQGCADAPEPMCHAARLTLRKDGHANGESQVLRRVLNHPHHHVRARAGARRTARPGQALQSVHSFICSFVSHSLRRPSKPQKLTFFCSQESALKRSLLKLSRLFLQPLVHLL